MNPNTLVWAFRVRTFLITIESCEYFGANKYFFVMCMHNSIVGVSSFLAMCRISLRIGE